MTKFKADTVDDFLKAAHKKFGGDSAGATDVDQTKLWKGRFNKGKLTNLSFTLPITMDYAEVGGGKPDKANKDAIAKVAQLARQHEAKHKASYEAAFKEWDPEQVTKDLESKTYKNEKEMNKAVNDALDDLDRAALPRSAQERGGDCCGTQTGRLHRRQHGTRRSKRLRVF